MCIDVFSPEPPNFSSLRNVYLLAILTPLLLGIMASLTAYLCSSVPLHHSPRHQYIFIIYYSRCQLVYNGYHQRLLA